MKDIIFGSVISIAVCLLVFVVIYDRTKSDMVINGHFERKGRLYSVEYIAKKSDIEKQVMAEWGKLKEKDNE